MRILIKSLFLFIITCVNAYALTYPLNQNTEMVGKVFSVTPQNMDTFSRYARIYDVGAYALQHANPGINEDYPDKQKKDIVIPGAFILPSTREGIVVNLPELRLYYFTATDVSTFPVSVGRDGWGTPVAHTTIVRKEKDPVWVVPDSILAESAAKGRSIPAVMPAGPKNPLGLYALHLGMNGYLIHGTNTPTSIGRPVSHGCIRMFPADIEQVFNMVSVNTPVSIINEPIKAAWQDNKLYLQVYPSLHQYPMSETDRQTLAKNALTTASNGKNVQVDWHLVDTVMKQQTGIPQIVGK